MIQLRKHLSILLISIGVLTGLSILKYPSLYSGDIASERASKEIENSIIAKKPKYAYSDEYAKIERLKRIQYGKDEPTYSDNQLIEEYKKAVERKASLRVSEDDLEFIERGPGNIGGRTRALIVDPDDESQNTFYAGAASGGLWKTTDAGANWRYIANDFPNLGINTLAMAPSNTNVIYAGTGEHYINDIDGSGLFKSLDKGESWIQIANPEEYPSFKNIGRIIIDPNDENTILATTRNSVWASTFESSIYKSTNGGDTWTEVLNSTTLRFDDLDADPNDFNTIYASANTFGIYKSIDAGNTWIESNDGLNPTGRVEITVSPVNTQRIWVSAEGGVSGTTFDLYTSSDGGLLWDLVLNETGPNQDVFFGQGFYDNIITAHPFDENIAYVGGVDLLQIELTGNKVTDAQGLESSENGTETFMTYANFGGGLLDGGADFGSVPFEELRSIEIKFGEGNQFAHRFTVDDRASGVPSSDYTYEDYVVVPFKVFDKETEEQLMVSFRDQQEDGVWNLIEINTSGENQSREYLFIHNVVYEETPNEYISVDGGHVFQDMYFIWPVLSPDATFDPDSLPFSNLTIEKVTIDAIGRNTTIVADARGNYDGTNAFDFLDRDRGIHPDHHNIIPYDIDETDSTFRLLVANDGGVYKSIKSKLPGDDGDFEYISYGYNTSQFYGADKAPNEYRFVGGMQDNGTWFHATGTDANSESFAVFGFGGDGFESLWHSTDVDKIIGGSQFNGVLYTLDQGLSWNPTNGLPSGPFRTQLTHNKSEPDVIFAISSGIVYKSTDFGANWSPSTMDDNSAGQIVEASVGNPMIIWTGGFLTSTTRLQVSTDQGETFSNTGNYEEMEMGWVSGIGTHPSDDNTAYAIFSFQGAPKVLRTTDLGESWEDISGFDGTGDRGFPDVATNSIFVMPNNTNQIWVGTEIGIVESLDNGASWNLRSDFPPINVHNMILQDSTVTLATYGRGIWSVDIGGDNEPPVEPLSVSTNSNFRIFPSIVSPGDNIQYSDASSGSFEIYDLNGRIARKIQTLENSSTGSISTSGLKSGAYIIRENNNISKFIIK